ncbi:peptidoglycan-binding domain-containing protein [Thermomonospora umbrina]|uniref:CHAP domain-containing protein n=1 Tax=Thermomonospora umbrina TaxID=111806 RepID=A0A3D9SGX0_9ACTN|nr:peptidoglycan-binding domain-containing protein [Thermomonospora umbrina]REE95149.1 CHAP domain-containing protein [Thermomonospora umbrina]
MTSPNDAIRIAKREIGFRESGTNDTKYNRWLGRIGGYPHGGYGYPWCASFQSWIADEAGMRANVDYPRTASCHQGVKWFKDRGRFSRTPRPGDWVFYGPNGATHVELVVRVTGTTITTVGGNTSGSLGGRYYNGDGVYEKAIYRSNPRIHGYGRPKYSEASPKPPAHPGRVLELRDPYMSGDDVKAVQRRLDRLGSSLTVDGVYGPRTRSAVVAFQRENGRLAVDGEVGPKTWAALFNGGGNDR